MALTKPSSGSRLGAIRCALLVGAQLHRTAARLLQRLPHRWVGASAANAGAGAVAAAGLVQHRRDHRRQLGRFQVLPRAGAQAFGDQQVALAVDAGQQPAVVGDVRIGGRALR